VFVRHRGGQNQKGNRILPPLQIIKVHQRPKMADSESRPLERHLRDVLCARVHTPKAGAALIAAGRAALGQP